MWRRSFDNITRSQLIAFLAIAGLFFIILVMSEPGFVFLLDHANLLFHEAGHVFFGLISRRLEIYGGTMGQLVFPVFLAISFWRKGQLLSFASAAFWFFENFLNIARYIGDARALRLPLVGGGEHDWNTILNRWHLLSYDGGIALTVKTIGWLGMIAVCVWVVWHHRKTMMVS
jgi:hypothetical protein